MSDRIWIQFAENGNIRKWQSEPFDGGTEYVVAYLADAELEEARKREGLARTVIGYLLADHTPVGLRGIQALNRAVAFLASKEASQ